MNPDTMWRHHSSPLSGWTRSLTQPLMCVPLWNRSWKQGLVLAAWLAANPYIFPEPKDARAWMTRAILGERLWVDEVTPQIAQGRPPLRDPALLMGILHALVLGASLRAAWRRRLLPAAALSASAVVLNLVHLDMLAAVYDEQANETPA